MRHREHISIGRFKIYLHRLSALPTRTAFAGLNLAQRKKFASISNVKRQREFLACKGVQAALLKKHPRHHLSLSHAHGWGVFAFAASRVGVDAESQAEAITESMLQLLVANPAEAQWAYPAGQFCRQRVLDLWLVKEALFKACAAKLATFDPQLWPVRTATAGCLPVHLTRKFHVTLFTRRGLRVAVVLPVKRR